MKRILYFGYFIKSTDYGQLWKDFARVKNKHGISHLKLFLDMIVSSFRYKSSFHDYFMYGFYAKDDQQRNSYLTTGGLYEFYTALNVKSQTVNFRDKAKFNQIFSKYIRRDYLYLNHHDFEKFDEWIIGRDCIVAKPNKGVAGRGIEKIYVGDYSTAKGLYDHLISKGLNLIEECIVQHPKINEINPSSVNTIRVITVKWKDSVDIIGAAFRIGVDKYVDNFSAGGIAAPVEITTGKVYKPAVSKRELVTYSHHPKTNCKIEGFKIPFWDDVIDMVNGASMIIPSVKTIGWDIAITSNGPELVEGNDNWDKDILQLTTGMGKKNMLEKCLLVDRDREFD